MSKKRKTKKEKIILNLKRQLATQEEIKIDQATPEKPQPKASFSPSVQKNKKTTPAIVIAGQEIKRDLVKSFFLSAFAIICLFLLYSR